jgi:hypothetical protein
MRLKSRVHSLERRSGGKPRICTCDGWAREVWLNDYRTDRPDPGPEICPKCGRPRVTILIRVVDGHGNLWGLDGEEAEPTEPGEGAA